MSMHLYSKTSNMTWFFVMLAVIISYTFRIWNCECQQQPQWVSMSLFMRLYKQQYFSITHTPWTYYASKYLSFSSYTPQFFLSTIVLLLFLPEHSILPILTVTPLFAFFFRVRSLKIPGVFTSKAFPPMFLNPFQPHCHPTNPLIFNKDLSDLHTTQSSFNWHYLMTHSFSKHFLTWLFCLTFFFITLAISGHSHGAVSSLPLCSLCAVL